MEKLAKAVLVWKKYGIFLVKENKNTSYIQTTKWRGEAWMSETDRNRRKPLCVGQMGVEDVFKSRR